MPSSAPVPVPTSAADIGISPLRREASSRALRTNPKRRSVCRRSGSRVPPHNRRVAQSSRPILRRNFADSQKQASKVWESWFSC
jgi:hypothetical protein